MKDWFALNIEELTEKLNDIMEDSSKCAYNKQKVSEIINKRIEELK